jgi:hypothetical protein
MTLVGIYNTEIVIPQLEQPTGQLVFYFVVHCDLTERPNVLTLEVTLPGEAPRAMPVMIGVPPPPMEGRQRWMIQLPFPIMQPVLRPGRIEGRVLFDGANPVDIRGPWISLSAAPQATRTTAS